RPLPRQNAPSLACPASPYSAPPCQTLPNPACHAKPCPALPQLTTPAVSGRVEILPHHREELLILLIPLEQRLPLPLHRVQHQLPTKRILRYLRDRIERVTVRLRNRHEPPDQPRRAVLARRPH